MKAVLIYTILILCTFSIISCQINNEKHAVLENVELIDSIFNKCRQADRLPIDTIRKYTEIAFELANISQNPNYIYEAHFFQCVLLFHASQYEESLDWVEKTLNLPPLTIDTLFITDKAKILKSAIFIRLNQQQKAIDYSFELLPFIEQNGNRGNLLRLYNTIGIANVDLMRKEEGIKWYRKIWEYDNDSTCNMRLVSALNMGDAYANIGTLDSAEKYATHAIKVANNLNNIRVQANALNTLGKVYTIQQKYKQAEEVVRKSIEIRKLHDNPYYYVADLVQLSDIYHVSNRPDECESAALEALEIAQFHQFSNQYIMIYTALYKSQILKKNYVKATFYAEKLINLLRNNAENAPGEAYAELEVKYETAKKEQKITEQNHELEKKNFTIIIGGILLLLIIITGFLWMKLNEHKSKQEIQNTIIKEQSEASKAIILAEEQERSRMSQILHDGVGQLLSGINMNLQALEEIIQNDYHKKIYNNSLSLLEDSVQEIRNISHQILPNNINKLGLIKATQLMLDRIPKNKININYTYSGNFSLFNEDFQLMIYRIIQESINNVIKHADATQLCIKLLNENNFVKLIINDNGKGFDTKSKNINKGIGINNIISRIRYLKGKLEIYSEINKGTEIKIIIPIDKNNH